MRERACGSHGLLLQDLWLPSTSCTSTVCRTKTRFSSSSSSNTQVPEHSCQLPCCPCCHRFLLMQSRIQVLQQPFEITYGTGMVEGVIAESTVALGSPAVTVSNQVFGDALQLTADFIATSCDGLFVRPFSAVKAAARPAPELCCSSLWQAGFS